MSTRAERAAPGLLARPSSEPEAALRRLRLVGLLAPALFVAGMVLARPVVLGTLGDDLGFAVLGAGLVASALVFGVAMYWLLGRAHRLVLESGRREAALVERERIARELHDSIAQVLGVTHLRLHALAGRPEVAASDRAHRETLELASICHESYRDVREAILGLKDATRSDRTLLEHLATYVAKFSASSSIPTTLHAESDDELRLPPAAEIQVIRVIQEALTNVRKHSGAAQASVRVRVADDHTLFVVEDDGTGFDPDAVAGERDGFGLSAMRERTESVDGRLTIDSAPGHGTRVVVRLPGRRATTSLAPEELIA